MVNVVSCVTPAASIAPLTTTTTTTTLPPITSTGAPTEMLVECEPITIPMCQQMPYNSTRMPNLMAMNSQEDALIDLETFRYLPDTSCSPYLVFFLCVIYTPICTSSLPVPLDPIPPCRQVCDQVRTNCESLINKMGFTWPHFLECKRFPDMHRGVCLTPEPILKQNTRPAVKSLEQCPCFRHPKLKQRLYTNRKFDYAIRGKVYASETFGMLTVSDLEVIQVFKHGSVTVEASSRIVLWTNSSCGTCPRLDVGREYFLLGHEDAPNQRLLFTSMSVALEWRKKYAMLITKWDKRIANKKHVKKHPNKDHSDQNVDSTVA